MLQTVWAVVREGKIVLLEHLALPEGTKLLVTLLPDEGEQQFWLRVSDHSLVHVWENAEDDVYADLLKE